MELHDNRLFVFQAVDQPNSECRKQIVPLSLIHASLRQAYTQAYSDTHIAGYHTASYFFLPVACHLP